ncbi:MAG: hypothetical protein KAU35_06775, partial [candidate division Zixibacteria bacterium]|nr:hypothetical protein [candidate division Zixibacteria bacterium]
MKRKLLYSTLVFLAFLFLAESAARLVEWSISQKARAAELSPGWQARFFALSFGWHEPDPDLLWRFRANISNRFIRTNSSHLIGDELPVRKAPGTIRILLLGDSSPVGLGLESYRFAFGELLRQQLEAELGPQTTVELVNASVSGYSSEQM